MGSLKNVINVFEKWAGEYFMNLKESQKYIVTVEGYIVDPAVPWANGQIPLVYQHKDEMEAFLEVLAKHRLSGTCLEIGFENGGLHVILREVFNKVISLEISLYKIVNFTNHSKLDNRSLIICGDSTQRQTRKLIQQHGKDLDLLFIDADHSYNGIQNDYMLYRDLVKEGGIVAFHDTAGRHQKHFDIQAFLTKLRSGEIDGEPHKVNDIIKSGTGISYEIVKKNPRWWLASEEIENRDKEIGQLKKELAMRDKKIEGLEKKLEKKDI